MTTKPLAEIISETLQRNDIQLPVFNQVAMRVQAMLRREDYNANNLAQLIHQDAALASRVLEVANSSFYAGLRSVKTIQEAVIRLGSQTISSVVLSISQKQLYKTRVKEFSPWINQLWSHALGVGIASRWLCQSLGFQSLAEESFMAGLLHDIGKLLLLRIIDELLVKGKIARNLSKGLISDLLESMHPYYGGVLLKKQNMPELYSFVAEQHHNREVGGDNTVLHIVRLGNLTCHKLGIGPTHTPEIMLSTSSEAIKLMAKDMMLAELQVKLESFVAAVSRFM